MNQYHQSLRSIILNGQMRPSRAKLADGSTPDTLGVFGLQTRYPLTSSFPMVTTKKMGTKGFVTELLWFLRGDTNTAFLKEHNCDIWDEWADANGELGPVYGAQWRRWRDSDGGNIDQIATLVKDLKGNPYSRRHLLSSWNVADLPDMALPPCHVLAQFYVSADKKLSCQLYQRSADMFLGVPWNIAGYALLTCMLAHVTGLGRGELVHTIGDAHIYSNHIAQVNEQLSRTCLPLPTLWLDPSIKNIDDFKHEHIRIDGYTSHAPIKAEVAV